jgi:hypothetical protein
VERAAKELRDATFAQNLALFAQRVGKPLFSRSPSERPPSLFEYVPLGCLVGNDPPPVLVPADAFWYNHHRGKHSLGGGLAMEKAEFESMVAPFLPLLRSDGAVEAQVAAGLPVSTAPDAGRPTASNSGSATSPSLLDFTQRPNYLLEPQPKVHPTTSLSFGTSPPMLKRGRCSDAHLRCAATALRCRSCAGRRSRCRSRRTKCWRRSSLSASLRSCRRCARYGMLPQLGRPGPLLHLPLPSGCHRARRRWGAERLVCCRAAAHVRGGPAPEWTCGSCTLLNPHEALACDVCTNPRAGAAPAGTVFAPLPMHSAACTRCGYPTAQCPSFRWQVELPVPSLQLLPAPVPALEPLLPLRKLPVRSSRSFSKPPNSPGGRRSASALLPPTSVRRASLTTTSKASASTAARARC